MEYRKDVDGLRAVAVVPALFFHAGFTGFEGGYVGLEIFFVVSGYLITNIILSEKSKGRFTLADFYERRARRIIPALSLVLLVTTVACYILMPAYLLRWYSQSLISVSTFLSNYYFYFTTDYFAPSAGEKPLIHMWSLAVEEQYYFFYPLFILLMTAFAKRWLAVSVAFIALLSLGLAETLALLGENEVNYYDTFCRVWELLFGSLIAILQLDKKDYPQWLREIACVLGLLMIAYSVFFFDEHTLYPSVLTVIPVLGTCFIIIFGNSSVFVSKMISLRFVVGIGLMSYSVYLWHHPIYAFLRLKTIGEPSFESFVVAILLSLALGYLTWRFVEAPFRDKNRFTRREIFSFTLASILVFVALGMLGHNLKGFKSRFSNNDYAESVKYSPKRGKCHTRGARYLPPSKACEYFGENIDWAVMGDSHTVEIAYQLAKKLEEKNIGIKHLSHSFCPATLYFRAKSPGCSDWFHETLSYLEHNQRISKVFLTYRHTMYLFGEHRYTYPQLPDNDANNYFDKDSRVDSPEEAREIYWNGFKDTIERLRKSGKTVYVLYPIPEIQMEFRNAIMPFSIFSEGTLIDLEKTTSLEYYYKRHEFILKKLDSLPYDDSLIAVNPVMNFCTNGFCSAVKDGKALYIDDDHPSLSGAELVIESMFLE